PTARRHTECSSEIAVGAAACRRRLQDEAEFSRDGARFFEQGNRSGLALHRRTVDATGDGELAVRIGDLEAAKQFFHIRCIACLSDPDIDVGPGLRSDYIRPRSTSDHTTIYRQFSR